MREIMFRGKKIYGGNWVYGSLIHRGKYCCILQSEKDIHPMDDPYLDSDLGTIDGYATPVDPVTVGQFTGTLDKNGKRIFEGDLLVMATSRTHEIKFADGGFFMEGTAIPFRYVGKFTITGNRWDNPELMEEKE